MGREQGMDRREPQRRNLGRRRGARPARTLLVFLALLPVLPSPARALLDPLTEQEEYHVFSQTLGRIPGMERVELFVLDEATAVTRPVEEAALARLLHDSFQPQASTLADFRRSNETAYRLMPLFEKVLRYRVIPQEEAHWFGSSKKRWKQFLNQFPGAGGLFTLSRVGFNEGTTEALVEVGVRSNLEEARRVYVLLHRDPEEGWRPVGWHWLEGPAEP